MRKLSFIHLVSLLLLISFCNQKQEASKNDYIIKNRNFNFQNKLVNKFNQRIHVTTTDFYKLFVYENSEGTNDSLKFFKNNQVYFNSVFLKQIDAKIIKFNNVDLPLGKYYFENQKDYRGNHIFFINNRDGLIFSEALNSGFMTEYDTEKYHNLHKAIALRQLDFKSGNFELQFATMKYPE